MRSFRLDRLNSSLCGAAGSSGLVVLAADVTVPSGYCIPLPAAVATSFEVAVSPMRLVPYLTVIDGVLRFPSQVTPTVADFSTLKSRARAARGQRIASRLLEFEDAPIELPPVAD